MKQLHFRDGWRISRAKISHIAEVSAGSLLRETKCLVKFIRVATSVASRRAYSHSLQRLGLYIKDTMRDGARPRRCYLMFLRCHKKPNLLQ